MPNQSLKSVAINWKMLSLVQFSLAILVILLHAGRIFPQDSLHFIQKSLFSRVAVPFFAISSSFFYQYQLAQGYCRLKDLILSLRKTYLFWSLIFLPFALVYLAQKSIPLDQVPLALLIALFYTGTCYHLWYIPAFLTGYSLIHFFRRFLSLKTCLFISLILYSFGLLETYSAYTAGTLIGHFYQTYQHIFWTARNGIFYMPVFVCLGELAYQFHLKKLKYSQLKTGLCLSLLTFALEGWIVFRHQGIDKNFFLGLLPLSLFLFTWTIQTPLLSSKNDQTLRVLKSLSRYYYFIHPIFIEIGFLCFPSNHRQDWQQGIKVFVLTLILTHVVSWRMVKYLSKKTLDS
ncbi:acyltransferase [Streptococcus ovuberis]|uniref:Acyltransferase n=1 Tax=Streptococcus ovuberis TaxID=1936207 RepID=A0A7X6S0Z2_9STRE|nr:acyltransferase [Streptococcus ovuberis]NKZ20703.1 acyltransferase [Streptococcus ovuberis]